MLAACRQVHEQFATFTSMVTGHLGLEDLLVEYPAYARHARGALGMVTGIDSSYLQLHAIRAVARACMQPSQLAALSLDVGVSELAFAAIDRTMRPDHRLAMLAGALRQAGWGVPPDPLNRDLPLHEFAEHDDPRFGDVEAWFYSRAAGLLRKVGGPTLDNDAHVPIVAQLHEQAEHETGSSLGYIRGGKRSEDDDLDVVLSAHESEALELRPALAAAVVASNVPLSALVSGDGADVHLFIALRPAARVAAQYDLDHRWPDGHLAMARTVTALAGKRVVVLRDLTDDDPAQLVELGIPILISASWRATADDELMRRWRPLLTIERSTVLCDLPISRHIISWMEGGDRDLEYTIVGVQTRFGVVRALVFRMVSSGGGRSRLHVAICSRTFIRAFDLWVDEHPRFYGRVRRVDDLAEDPSSLIERTLHHLILEERLFDLNAGERTWLKPTS